MDEGVTDELRRLRVRAYGPDADIAADPVALRRLAQLEAEATMLRVPVPEAPDAVPVAPPVIDRVPDELAQHPSGEETPDAADPAQEPGPEPVPARPRWVVPTAWAGSIFGAVALTAAATTAAVAPVTPMEPVPRDADVRHVTTLGVDPDFEMPEFFGGPDDEAEGFQVFRGMRVVSGMAAWGGPGVQDCLILLDDTKLDPDREGYDGQLYWGCGVGPFPATVSLAVTNDMPEELREEFPEGSSLQFVLDGTRIGVYHADSVEP